MKAMLARCGLALVVLCGATLISDLAFAQAAPASDLYLVRVQLDPQKANGTPWDGDGGAPEIRLVVVTPGGNQPARGTCQGLVCTYEGLYVPAGSLLNIYEEDVLQNDAVGRGPCEGLGQPGPTQFRLGQAVVTIERADRADARREREEQRERYAAAAPRALRADEVRSLLLNQTVAMTDGTPWRFEATEPFEARIVSQRNADGGSVVVVNVRTNSTDGRSPARGRIELVIAWNQGAPTLLRAAAQNFRMRT